MVMAFWLVKTEPEVYSIDDLKRDKSTCWDCVRNYEARNNLVAMKKGDSVLIYHSNSEPSGIAGVAEVKKTAYPDPQQFLKSSEYFDPKSTPENPRWFSPDLAFRQKFPHIVALSELREVPALAQMVLLRRGSRLSVMPVKAAEFKVICGLGVER